MTETHGATASNFLQNVGMDVNMPGMGGIAAAERLREECPMAYIILLTANIQEAIRQKAAKLNIGFMEKPITKARIQQLLAVLGASQ